MIRPDWLYQYPQTSTFFGTWPGTPWQVQPIVTVSTPLPMWAAMLIGACFALALTAAALELDRWRFMRAWRAEIDRQASDNAGTETPMKADEKSGKSAPMTAPERKE